MGKLNFVETNQTQEFQFKVVFKLIIGNAILLNSRSSPLIQLLYMTLNKCIKLAIYDLTVYNYNVSQCIEMVL